MGRKCDRSRSRCDCWLCSPESRALTDREDFLRALDQHGISHNLSDSNTETKMTPLAVSVCCVR